MTKTIVRILAGSNLYGVATPTSDKDIKSVFVADSVKDLYMGVKNSDVYNNGAEGKDKEEYEDFYIKQFAKLLIGGQTVIYDMLFAPPSNILESSPAWEELISNRSKLVSQNVFPFVSYARSQAIKYSLKGERLKTLKDFLAELRQYQEEDWFEHLTKMFKDREGIRFWADERGGVSTPMIEVCGKSFGKTTSRKLWIDPLQSLIKAYGDRAESAMMSDGKDLKAMYHAVRISNQCIELLQTGSVTFPRPNKDFLMDIRSGKVTYDEVAKAIDTNSEEIQKLLVTTTLPLKPDEKWIHDWAWRTQESYL